ncbi:E3 ubiquitin-protein ligase znrf1 [Sarcoptes scabiei]|nr:E3 ubiquitin-protein ligase znrf1 [Sarcoptes scabiei]
MAMFILLELCVRVRNSNLIIQPKRRYFSDFDFRYFWDWTDFLSYLECMAVFTLLAGLLFYFFIDVPWIVEGYGLVALVTESLLASPQFFRNLKVKSTEGMSKLMVLTWFLGDLYKTVYFFVREAPFQFLICGCTQITFDVLIFLQVIIYQKASYRKLSKSRLKHLENRAHKRYKAANIRSKKGIDIFPKTKPNSIDLDENKLSPLYTTSITYCNQRDADVDVNNLDVADCSSSFIQASVHFQQPGANHRQQLSTFVAGRNNRSILLNKKLSRASSVSDENLRIATSDLIELDGYENHGANLDPQLGHEHSNDFDRN